MMEYERAEKMAFIIDYVLKQASCENIEKIYQLIKALEDRDKVIEFKYLKHKRTR